jgi:hypothetical protein
MVCIAVGVILIAWWSGLALLAAFLFAGLAEVTDRPATDSSGSSASNPQDDRLAVNVRYELDSAA